MRSDDKIDDEFLQATMGCMDLLYNIARRMMASAEDAQDLVQETYLAAYRAWRDDRRPERVDKWIATICLNLGRSTFRKRAVRPHEVPLDTHVLMVPDSADPERDALAGLDRDALHAAIAMLPEEQRLALTLVDLGGLSTAEAAEAMGTPLGTVLSRVHRGRKALASLLTADIPESEEA